MAQGTLFNKTEPAKFNLQEIIQGEWVEAHFQPIVSLRRRSVVGFEGLSRGLHPGSRTLIPPTDLFHQAALQGLELDLDRLCRKKILDSFRLLPPSPLPLILFLNLDVSVLTEGVVGSGHLRRLVGEMGLKPENVAIEIIESDVEDLNQLQRFVQQYKGYGFLIALDDVGAGHSNLNRIPLIKPDILKIDRFLIQDIQSDFYKQEVLKSVVRMARHLGTLVIAEGVETQEEAGCLLEMDVDMVQGYYFSKPQRPDQLSTEPVLDRVEGLSGAFKRNFLRRIGVKRFNMNRYYATLLEIQMELAQKEPGQFDPVLKRMTGNFPQVESLYLLDETGVQVTESLFNRRGGPQRNPALFRPSPKGSNHTMKDYFYFLMEAGLNKTSYLTEPYLSMASGTSCVTLSSMFKNTRQQRYVLCLDIRTDSLGQEPAE